MLGAVRRNGVAQALRASGPRALYSKSIPQMLTWQRPSGTVFPAIVRSLHNSVPRSNGPASATAQAADPAEPVSEEAPLTQFADLAKRDLVHRRIITNIVGPMNIKTMTPVQSMTLSEILKGDDVLVFSIFFFPFSPFRNQILTSLLLLLQIGSGKDWNWKDTCVSRPCSAECHERSDHAPAWTLPL